MNLEFEIENLDKKEKALIPEFCLMLTESIRKDVKYNIRKSKFDIREKDILEATWIDWMRKPSSYNMIKLGNLIANSIVCEHIEKNLYSIKISRKVYMPLTRTKLSTIARFLDRGNETTPPMNFIHSVFNKYRLNINNYWKSFISLKLKRVETKEVITVK